MSAVYIAQALVFGYGGPRKPWVKITEEMCTECTGVGGTAKGLRPTTQSSHFLAGKARQGAKQPEPAQ